MSEFASPEAALDAAQSLFDSGDVKGAQAIIESGACGTDHSTRTGVAATWLLARVYGAQDWVEAEREMLVFTVNLGPGFGLEHEAEAAAERLRELDMLSSEV